MTHEGSGQAQQHEVSTPVEVVLELGYGRAVVTAGDQGLVSVEVLPARPGRAGDEALAQESTVTMSQGRLSVHVPRRSSFLGRTDSVEVRIEVPEHSRVGARSDNGSFELRGALGECRLTARHGSVTVEEAAELDVTSPYGTVDVARVGGRLTASVGYGSLRVTQVEGRAVLRGSHGSIDLGEVTGDAEVTTSGDVTLGTTSGHVVVRSAHGSVRVREARGGSLTLDSAYGGVDVGVGGGVGVWLDAHSRYGKVRNELVPDPSAATDGSTVELRLRSEYAGVRIRRVGGRR